MYFGLIALGNGVLGAGGRSSGNLSRGEIYVLVTVGAKGFCACGLEVGDAEGELRGIAGWKM
jgi:hypothetical protein